jgi:SAM-dependent methyltransferase
VWRVLDRSLPREGRFLDLGCGTGEDAVWLARRGATHVDGCDASERMLAEARRKADDAGVGGRISLSRLDLRRLEKVPPFPDSAFDGILANFGVLNCLDDRRPLAERAARWLVPGGQFVMVVMGPWCGWEIAWHLLRLQPSAAFRRWRPGRDVPLDGGGSIPVWYPTARRLRREFEGAFEHVETVGIGVFQPPPYLESVLARRPRLASLLEGLDRRHGRRWPWRWYGDHLLLRLRDTSRC